MIVMIRMRIQETKSKCAGFFVGYRQPLMEEHGIIIAKIANDNPSCASICRQ